MAPEDNLTKELLSFFSNTLKMHGSGQMSSQTVSISRAEKSLTTRVSGKPRSSNDENEYIRSGNRISSSEEKDVSAGKVDNRVNIPFYAPHLFHEYYKLAKKTEEDNDDGGDVNDVKPPEVHEEEVVPLDLTGDLISHLVCLDCVRGLDDNAYASPAMMGPPPPPPPPPLILISMIASEQGGIHHQRLHPSGQMPMLRPPFIPNEVPMNHFLDKVTFLFCLFTRQNL